jgi:hypothetical protein
MNPTLRQIKISFWPLWTSFALLAALDIIVASQVLSFINYSADWRCCYGSMWAFDKVTFFSILSLPVAMYVMVTYRSLRAHTSPFLQFVIRLPVVCLVALALAFFVVFRFL